MEIITQELKKMTTEIEYLKEENEKLKAKHDKFQCAKCKGHHTGCANPTCDSCVEELKEENCKFTDALDEKDEEIQKLTTQLAQKSNEVGNHQSRLCHEQNGLRSKLLNRDKQIEELKEQIDQSKLNAIQAKDDKIALLEQKVDELQQRGSVPAHKIYNDVEKMKHFRSFLNQYYEWIEPTTLSKNTKRANIPFDFVLRNIHRVSGTDTSKPKFLMKGPRAYWPDQTIMIKYLKIHQKERYGEHNWKCPAKQDINAYNGCHETFAQIRFDLKEKS